MNEEMIGKTWTIRQEGVLITYEIVNVDVDGWIKIKRQGVETKGGHFYLHEKIHRHFLTKIGYVRKEKK
jgi:hypothetical protein